MDKDLYEAIENMKNDELIDASDELELKISNDYGVPIGELELLMAYEQELTKRSDL